MLNFGSNIHRDEIIYGILPVLESLRAKNRKIQKIFISVGKQEKRVSEIIGLAQKRNIPIHKISNEEISGLVRSNVNHQGVLAGVARAKYYDGQQLIEEIVSKQGSLSLILDGVEDPGNLGAILRTAECSGVDGVFIPDRRAVGINETVVKSSAGASEYVKVAKVTNINRLIDDLKKQNVWIVGASNDSTSDYTEWDWSRATALVLGGEGKGLHHLTSQKCDVLVKIPMCVRIESLNVSVAAGVILFEAIRQKKRK